MQYINRMPQQHCMKLTSNTCLSSFSLICCFHSLTGVVKIYHFCNVQNWAFCGAFERFLPASDWRWLVSYNFIPSAVNLWHSLEGSDRTLTYCMLICCLKNLDHLCCTMAPELTTIHAGIRTLDLTLICYAVPYLASIRMCWCSISIYFWVVLCFERSVPRMTFLQLTGTGLCFSNLRSLSWRNDLLSEEWFYCNLQRW